MQRSERTAQCPLRIAAVEFTPIGDDPRLRAFPIIVQPPRVCCPALMVEDSSATFK